jgi:hypothetical protein
MGIKSRLYIGNCSPSLEGKLEYGEESLLVLILLNLLVFSLSLLTILPPIAYFAILRPLLIGLGSELPLHFQRSGFIGGLQSFRALLTHFMV